MTLTTAQIDAVEKLIATSRSNAYIAQKLNLPPEEVAACRAERKRRVKREKNRREWAEERVARQDLPRGYARDTSAGMWDDGGLLAALKAHMPPLQSFAYRDGMRVIGWAA